MKKGISKQKNDIRMKKIKKQLAAVALLSAMLCGLIGAKMPVHGEEAAAKVVVTDIYHRHIGSGTEQGGCYQKEIAHIHQGNETEGGECFKAPVLHVHQGDAVSGTGCYTQAVYHVHEGDGQSEGGCYTAIYHTHGDGCYENKICTIRYTKGEVTGSSTKECDEHGSYEHEVASGTALHENCGAGEVSVLLEYCAGCGPMTYSYHTYKEAVCGMDTDQPTGYGQTCGKDESTIEGYRAECGYEEGQVSGYQLSCGKSVDGYARDCGLDENVPCGKLIITNETKDCQEKVTVSVRMEDLSGGKLVLSDTPFAWYDETGKCIGTGDKIEVGKNGKYTVELKLQNKDVDEKGLRGSIAVDNVLEKEDASPSPDTEKTPAPTATTAPTPAKGKEDTDPSSDPQPTEGSSEEPSGEEASEGEEVPQTTPIPTQQPSAGEENDNGLTGNNHRSSQEDPGEDSSKETISRVPEAKAPVVKKQTQKKELPEKMAALPVPVEVQKIGFWQKIFAIPQVRIVTIAAGTLLLLAGLFLLLFYIRNSVRLYNDDGEGRFICLGRCRIRLEEDGYAMTISEKAVEKAYTNRYCIRPGLFRLGKGDQELLVYKDTKRVTVALNKEMIFMI